MSTLPGKMKILVDNEVRVVSSAAQTVNGSAQNKGTATDLVVTLVAGPDGASAVAGTVIPTIQGANASTFASPTTVTPDKGTLANITTSGTQTVHLAQLQYQYYRLNLNASVAATADVSAVWNFHPVEDSFDASVQ